MKSYLWILLPLSIFGGFESCSTYIEAGSKLTPYSVSVSGYQRKDGTYVRPHNRRPPRSVKRDAPWKGKRFLMGTLFLGSVALGLGSVFITYSVSVNKIDEKESQIKLLLKKRNSIHKNILGKNISHRISQEIDFDQLPEIPQYLLFDDKKECKYKHKELTRTHFYVRYKAIKYSYRVCLAHVRTLPSIGRGQPRSKYLKEIEYFEKYENLKGSFREKFETHATEQSFKFSKSEIEDYFYTIYKEITSTNNVHKT